MRLRNRNWLLDGLGNFAAFDDDGDAQTRTHNAANEIESLVPEGGQPVTMLHDAAGNLLDDGVLKYTYDAWNRQVAVRRAADDTLVAEYAFDGRGRRVEKSVFDGDEELLATTGYFHNHRWQVLEEHCLPAGEQEAVRTEYVWSATYIDSPIARGRHWLCQWESVLTLRRGRLGRSLGIGVSCGILARPDPSRLPRRTF